MPIPSSAPAPAPAVPTPSVRFFPKAMHVIMTLCASLTLAASVNWANGVYVSALGMVFVGLLSLIFNAGSANKLEPLTGNEKWLLATWLLYPVYAGAVILIRGNLDEGFFQESSRFLVIIPVFLTIRRYGLSMAFLRWGVLVGAVAAGVWAYYQKIILGIARPWGGTGQHIAAFGNIALLLGVLSIALWQPVWRINWRWIIVPFIALSFGLFASLVSGNKGGWISLPFLIWLATGLVDKPTAKKSVLVMCALVAAMVVVYFYNDSVRGRVSVILPAIYEYFVNGKVYDGSAGVRLALWHGSFLVFLDHPLWGVGFDGYREAVKPFIASGQVPAAAGSLNPHSQFFDKLVVFGWMGPVLVFGIYFRFMKFCHSYRVQQKSLAIAGLMLAVGYIDFGLVEFVWYRNNMGVFFTMMMAIISGQLAYYNLNPVVAQGPGPVGDTSP